MSGLELEEQVRLAWASTLSPVEVDPALSWEEAGADSLLSLRLLLRLEKMLGRKLSFDMIDPDMTISSLATRLATERASVGRVHDLPVVFLVPGLFGDEPILADFRRWFGATLHFELVELPDLDQVSAILTSLIETGQAIAREIERRKPQGDLIIAGYSIGGGAAYEAAQVLLEQGRTVALLCILDAPLHSEDKSTGWEGDHLVKDLARVMIRLLAPWDLARRLIFAATRVVRPRALIEMRRLLLRRLRSRALERWRPTRLAAPTLLVVSGELEREVPSNWFRLLPSVTVVRTAGGHRDLFSPAALERLGPSVLTSVATAEGASGDVGIRRYAGEATGQAAGSFARMID